MHAPGHPEADALPKHHHQVLSSWAEAFVGQWFEFDNSGACGMPFVRRRGVAGSFSEVAPDARSRATPPQWQGSDQAAKSPAARAEPGMKLRREPPFL